MEITAIKDRLSLSEVLQHYSLQPKNNMLKCFMHDDKTASLQVNLEKNFYKCHACGKTGDVIQFIEDYEKISKHEAIKKAGSLIGNKELSVKNIRGTAESLGRTDFPGERSALFLETQSSNIDVDGGTGEWQAEFLGRMLAYFKKGLYNSKQAKEYLEKRGLDFTRIEVGYNGGQFHHGERKSEELIRKSLEVGLLIDKNLIGRTGEKAYQPFAKWSICFGLRNKENEVTGLYFRSILNDDKARHFYLKNRSGIYPGYPKKETKKLILTEAIIDCASLLQIKKIRENYSLISCFGTNGLTEEMTVAVSQLKQLEEIIFCFDNDGAGKKAAEKYSKILKDNLQTASLTVRFSFVELPNKDVNETLQLHDEDIFKELLEKRKDIFLSSEEKIKVTENVPSRHRTQTNDLNHLDFLQQKDLLKSLNQLIEKAGIIGEENSRLLLFLITISYLNKSPLHGIVQGSSGSGKTHIISRIADMMPQEDVLRFTRITESSLYNWGEFDLFQKIIIIEDLDGLKEDALYALREFISNQVLRSSVTIKDKKGNNKSSHKIVKGQFSSLSATTKGELYEDNMNRSFIIAINESEEQTEKIINYQNRRNAGEVDKSEEQKAINFIQKIVRNLKHYEVINPFATQIQLPNNVKNKRRLNEMFQSIIKQITLIHQFQREVKNGFLVTEIEDIENAVEILFESIILKIDELDGSLRQFFEKLKKAFKEESFTRFDAMEVTGFKKTQLQFYLNDLVRLEYLKQIGFANKGFKYKISYSDNIQKIRKDLKEAFTKQLEDLKKKK